jgi:hypothetical protein
MLLFHPRDFLFALLPLLAGNLSLLAFDIPAELPSGPTIHLNIKWLSVDTDSYSVSITTEIKDQEEIRLFSENPEVLGLMSQSIQEKWGLYNFEFKLRDPNEFRLISAIGTLTDLGAFKAYTPSLFIFSENKELLTHGSITLSGGTLIAEGKPTLNAGTLAGGRTFEETGSGTLTLSDTFIGSTTVHNGQLILSDLSFSDTVGTRGIEEKNTPSEISSPNSHLPLENQDVKTIASTETPLIVGNSQDGATEEPPTFNLSFSTVGSNFGGGWRLTPYELRFIQKKANFLDKGYTKDDIETMALLIAPDEYELYQKQYTYPDFSPAGDTSYVLTQGPDNTFELRSPLIGKFFFNNAGQLMRSLREDSLFSVCDYYDGKLINIHHANNLNLSFEYEGKKVTSISGLPNKVYLEYNDQGYLSKIFDKEGASLHFSYEFEDEDIDLDKIIDDAGTVVYGNPDNKGAVKESGEIPLLFNGFGELFYYKNSQNLWKLSYRNWASQDDE